MGITDCAAEAVGVTLLSTYVEKQTVPMVPLGPLASLLGLAFGVAFPGHPPSSQINVPTGPVMA